jgi:uncharacterized protein (DUF427 family)
VEGGIDMFKAMYKDQVIAKSSNTITVEGNEYFPKEDVDFTFLTQSQHHTTCPWKGLASYYNVTDGSSTIDNAAWTYLDPKPEASKIKAYLAFWKDVKVIKE